MPTVSVFAPRPCIVCTKVHAVEYSPANLGEFRAIVAWSKGEERASRLEFLSAGQREVLISGTGEECWNVLFPEEEEDIPEYGYPEETE